MLELHRWYLWIHYRRIGIDYLRSMLAGLLFNGSVDRMHKLRRGHFPAAVKLGHMLRVSRRLILCRDGSRCGDGVVLGGSVFDLGREYVLGLFSGHVPIERELKPLFALHRGIILLDEWPLGAIAMSSW